MYQGNHGLFNETSVKLAILCGRVLVPVAGTHDSSQTRAVGWRAWSGEPEGSCAFMQLTDGNSTPAHSSSLMPAIWRMFGRKAQKKPDHRSGCKNREIPDSVWNQISVLSYLTLRNTSLHFTWLLSTLTTHRSTLGRQDPRFDGLGPMFRLPGLERLVVGATRLDPFAGMRVFIHSRPALAAAIAGGCWRTW